MIDKFGGRKFVGFVFVSTLLFVLALTGKVDAGTVVAFLTTNFGVYVGGNGIEHYLGSEKG